MFKSNLLTKFFKTLITIVIGLIFVFIFFEIALLVFGKLERIIQKVKNNFSKTDEFVILALGESTTAPVYDWNFNEYSWPTILQKILKKADLNKEIKIFNEGTGGVNTHVILNNLEKNIEKYDPDLVISMMGINDYFGEIVYERAANIEADSLPSKSRTYKLIKFLIANVKDKIQLNNKEELDCDSEESCLYLTTVYSGNNFEETELSIKFLNKALEYNPNNADILLELGWKNLFDYNLYTNDHSIQAATILEKALEIDPKNPLIYFSLLEALSRTRGPIDFNLQTIEHISSSIIHIPSYQMRWLKYSDNYRKKWKEKIIRNHKKIKENIELYEIKDADVFLALTNFILSYEDMLFLEDQIVLQYLKKAFEIEPNNASASLQLARYYVQYDNYSEAEKFYLQILQADVENEIYTTALIELANLYMDTGQKKLADEIFKQAINVEDMYVQNYQKLYEILTNKNIQLIAVQYPMRSIEPLELIFENNNSVLLVDNELIFKNVVKEKGYEQFFADRFAGDFGHCSEEGNLLLAENIASVIVENWEKIIR